MRKRKIRGHRRRQKQAIKWRDENLKLRSDIIDQYQYDHVDIVVHPWCDISIINSYYPEPKGVTKRVIISYLIEIYNSLKSQLEKQNKPFYLKLWLFEPRFSKSQVVCAIDDKIQYYNNLFIPSVSPNEINLTHYSGVSDQLKAFNWKQFIDEDHFEESFVGDSSEYENEETYLECKRWFEKQMKKPHRTSIYENSKEEYYSFDNGSVWIGEK